MFDLSAQALKRLELIGYIVLKLNYSINCNNLYLKKTFQVFKTILIEKEVKSTYTFLQTIPLGPLSNQRQLFCVYTTVRASVCVVFPSLAHYVHRSL